MTAPDNPSNRVKEPMMNACSEGTHRTTQDGWRIESSATLLVDCGPPGDPEVFSCCEVTEIRQRMAEGTQDGVDLDDFIASLDDQDAR